MEGGAEDKAEEDGYRAEEYVEEEEEEEEEEVVVVEEQEEYREEEEHEHEQQEEKQEAVGGVEEVEEVEVQRQKLAAFESEVREMMALQVCRGLNSTGYALVAAPCGIRNALSPHPEPSR